MDGLVSHGNEGEYLGCDERPDIQQMTDMEFMDENTHYDRLTICEFMDEEETE